MPQTPLIANIFGIDLDLRQPAWLSDDNHSEILGDIFAWILLYNPLNGNLIKNEVLARNIIKNVLKPLTMLPIGNIGVNNDLDTIYNSNDNMAKDMLLADKNKYVSIAKRITKSSFKNLKLAFGSPLLNVFTFKIFIFRHFNAHTLENEVPASVSSSINMVKRIWEILSSVYDASSSSIKQEVITFMLTIVSLLTFSIFWMFMSFYDTKILAGMLGLLNDINKHINNADMGLNNLADTLLPFGNSKSSLSIPLFQEKSINERLRMFWGIATYVTSLNSLTKSKFPLLVGLTSYVESRPLNPTQVTLHGFRAQASRAVAGRSSSFRPDQDNLLNVTKGLISFKTSADMKGALSLLQTALQIGVSTARAVEGEDDRNSGFTGEQLEQIADTLGTATTTLDGILNPSEELPSIL